ncbi:hypothetical protein C7378_1880 [Acidipila rosea]|uniref:CopC domain-containing protein n=2 Tax=Acidipila rosea TaxID=768535 RepID=A0A4R1L7Q9_9BACT|nr:hypothetical protein C7378_1880 [Acidipila rosea]
MLSRGRVVSGLLAVALGVCFAPRAFAHAVLVNSTPRVDATVDEGQLSVDLKFNSRIDGARSRLYLAGPDGKVQMLKTAPSRSPDELTTKIATLPGGKYVIRWQVLASDGHITRGEIPFTVR